jgi:hypothetical protein
MTRKEDVLTIADQRASSRARRNQTLKGTAMKTRIKPIVTIGCCVIAVVVFLPIKAQAKPPLYDYKFPITSHEQATGLKPGAKLAMACTKCKTVQVRDVDKKGNFLDWFAPETKHICPGCGGYWAPHVSYGIERRHSRWIHTCSKCGDKSMFCCSTEPGKKTAGM